MKLFFDTMSLVNIILSTRVERQFIMYHSADLLVFGTPHSHDPFATPAGSSPHRVVPAKTRQRKRLRKRLPRPRTRPLRMAPFTFLCIWVGGGKAVPPHRPLPDARPAAWVPSGSQRTQVGL